jgi:hypothetical protein
MVVKREIQGVPVRMSDDLYKIFETEFGDATNNMIIELRKTAEEYPNHTVIDFLGNDPASFRLSMKILTETSFGMDIMNVATGGTIGILAKNARQRQSLVQSIIKKLGEESIQTAHEFIQFANKHPEETQALIDAILNS